MYLKCIESNCPWFTNNEIYDVHHEGFLQWVFDDAGDEWFICENSNGKYQISGLDDALFEEHNK